MFGKVRLKFTKNGQTSVFFLFLFFWKTETSCWLWFLFLFFFGGRVERSNYVIWKNFNFLFFFFVHNSPINSSFFIFPFVRLSHTWFFRNFLQQFFINFAETEVFELLTQTEMVNTSVSVLKFFFFLFLVLAFVTLFKINFCYSWETSYYNQFCHHIRHVFFP